MSEKEKQILLVAASAYLSNVGEEDFPENFMDLLADGKLTDGDKEIVPWEPLEHFSPEDLCDVIDAQYWHTMKVVNNLLQGERHD